MTNLTLFNRAIRMAVGFGIIGAVLGVEQLPTWLLLLSPYPVITGIISWDPFHAVFGKSNTLAKDSNPVLPHGTHSASA